MSRAIAAEHRPTLEHFLISLFPLGIVGLERQKWINHHGEVSIVLKADGDAGKGGIDAQFHFLNRAALGFRKLE